MYIMHMYIYSLWKESWGESKENVWRNNDWKISKLETVNPHKGGLMSPSQETMKVNQMCPTTHGCSFLLNYFFLLFHFE